MKNNKKPRVVFDTNVWVSGLVFGGQPGQLLHLFVNDLLDVVVSEELLTELRRIINEKFPLYVPQLGLLEASIKQDVELVKLGNVTVTISRDSDDNKVIETAVVGACDYIVSGDNDLLVIGQYESIRILSPAEFLKVFGGR